MAVGTHWIEYFSQFCDPQLGSSQCGGNTYSFQNIETGKFRSDPTTATTLADPNLPDLTRKLCSPLRDPKQDARGGNQWAVIQELLAVPGLVTLDGPFALVQKTDFSTSDSTSISNIAAPACTSCNWPGLNFPVSATIPAWSSGMRLLTDWSGFCCQVEGASWFRYRAR